MFRKLRYQFIAITTLAITVILVALVGVINSVRYFQSEQDIQAVLNLLVENNGSIPITPENQSTFDNRYVSQGTLYNFNYFSARVKKDEVVLNTGTASNLTSEQIQGFTDEAVTQTDRNIGFIEQNGRYFSYKIHSLNDQENLIVFFETTNAFRDRWALLWLSIQIAIYSWIFFLGVVFIFSGMAIRPFVRNYEKQRTFITNAGHELKTPLAVISANNELQELLTGETEWTQSTKDQVDRLDHLIAKLIRLSRQEERTDIQMTRVNLSSLVQDVSHSMTSLWEQAGLTYQAEIEEGIEVEGSADDLYELVSILLDNARKYCDEGGRVRLHLSSSKMIFRQHVQLTIANDYAAGASQDYRQFFDRFYRADSSRTTLVSEEKRDGAEVRSRPSQGYGIGLSMAQHIVSLHRGRLSARYKDGVISFDLILN